MIYIWHFLPTCVLINFVTAYVLFAANLDDFKSIAKKFIPAKLADQIADMAAPTNIKYLHKAVDNEVEHTDNVSTVSEELNTSEDEPNTTPKNRFYVKNKLNDIDIDEIVEKVRIKLEKEYKNLKTTPQINVKQSFNHRQKSIKKDIVYENDSNDALEQVNDEEAIVNEELVTERASGKTNKLEYKELSQEKVREQPDTTEIENLFQEMDLKKPNDSYEDYATPKKEKMYGSDETEHSRLNEKYNSQKEYLQEQNSILNVKESNIITTPYDYNEEIKAKTENLFYDDKGVYITPSTDGDELNKAGYVKQSIDGVNRNKKGTMIPTRERYRMSSPNYYHKLPNKAEKYDFDEPIPEKDREPEKLKYIGNPPASVNRKVKL